MGNINETIRLLRICNINSVPKTSYWDEILFTTSKLLTYSESKTAFFNNNEKKGTLGCYEDEIGKKIYASDLAEKLREAMYNEFPEKGAWYAMEMTINKDGQFAMKFDYDNKPEFSIPMEDLDFIKDHQKFPRSEEYIPNWLGEILERNKISIS